MAVLRQSNFLAQQRIDLPALRLIESGVAGDFDLLAGRMLSGKKPLILTGFTLIAAGITRTDLLTMQVSNGTMIHYNASESGSIFSVPSDRPDEALTSTNPRVVGQFSPGSPGSPLTNYVGLDLVRVADPTTVDLVTFLNPSTMVEFTEEVPLGRTLDYRIVITTAAFTPGIAPVANVMVDSTGAITSVTDARSLFFRLGSGGTTPAVFSSYDWADGRRELAAPSFSGGDKAIGSLKAWCDAVMTRVWEIGGGENWYSAGTDRNVRMVHAGLPFGNGEHLEWTWDVPDVLTTGDLHWKGLRILFDNSTAYYNEIADVLGDTLGTTNLANGECIYIDLDRTRNRGAGGLDSTAITASKGTLSTLGPGPRPGTRVVLAWRLGTEIFTRDQSYPIGSTWRLATTTSDGGIRLSAVDSAAGSVGTRVATVWNTGYLAASAGVSRGAGTDFIGGAGDLTIGGAANDFNLLLLTLRSQDAVTVRGHQVFATGGDASLEVENLAAVLAPNNRLAAFTAYNNITDRNETATVIESTGAFGYRVVPVVPATPVPTLADPIRVKTFVQSAGTTPAKRDQFCIMWHDGTITVIAEGPLY